MRVLVIGGTGTVGSALVERLRGRGVDVRVMTRDPSERSIEGVEVVAGDLADSGSLGPAFDGVDRAYLLTPLHPDEAALGRAGVAAAAEAGLDRLVFQSVHRAETAPHVPHFATKIEIAESLREAGIPWSIVAPNSFFQNDLHLREPILEHGVYPQPIGSAGVSRVDVGDIADAAAVALLDDGWEGRTIPVAGPEPLTGEGSAAIWSRHVERPVEYAGDDLEPWATGAREVMPDWLVGDLVVMLRHFQEYGLVATSEDMAIVYDVLGREPRRFDDFVAETAAAWLSR